MRSTVGTARPGRPSRTRPGLRRQVRRSRPRTSGFAEEAPPPSTLPWGPCIATTPPRCEGEGRPNSLTAALSQREREPCCGRRTSEGQSESGSVEGGLDGGGDSVLVAVGDQRDLLALGRDPVHLVQLRADPQGLALVD